MQDIIEYYRWLYADFPNQFDIGMMCAFGIVIGMLIIFKAGDWVMR